MRTAHRDDKPARRRTSCASIRCGSWTQDRAKTRLQQECSRRGAAMPRIYSGHVYFFPRAPTLFFPGSQAAAWERGSCPSDPRKPSGIAPGAVLPGQACPRESGEGLTHFSFYVTTPPAAVAPSRKTGNGWRKNYAACLWLLLCSRTNGSRTRMMCCC